MEDPRGLLPVIAKCGSGTVAPTRGAAQPVRERRGELKNANRVACELPLAKMGLARGIVPAIVAPQLLPIKSA